LNVNTQAGDALDELEPFWKAVHHATFEQTGSLNAFTRYLAGQA